MNPIIAAAILAFSAVQVSARPVHARDVQNPVAKREAEPMMVEANPDGTLSKDAQEALERWEANQFGPVDPLPDNAGPVRHILIEREAEPVVTGNSRDPFDRVSFSVGFAPPINWPVLNPKAKREAEPVIAQIPPESMTKEFVAALQRSPPPLGFFLFPPIVSRPDSNPKAKREAEPMMVATNADGSLSEEAREALKKWEEYFGSDLPEVNV